MPELGEIVEEPSEAELRAVFGRRSEYYLAQWRAHTGRFNWAAFFWGPIWLLYRRMYLHAALLLCGVPIGALLDRGGGLPTGLGAGVICGACGNRWYLDHVRKVIAKTRAQRLPEPEHLRTLARRDAAPGNYALVALILFLVALAIGVSTGVLPSK